MVKQLFVILLVTNDYFFWQLLSSPDQLKADQLTKYLLLNYIGPHRRKPVKANSAITACVSAGR